MLSFLPSQSAPQEDQRRKTERKKKMQAESIRVAAEPDLEHTLPVQEPECPQDHDALRRELSGWDNWASVFSLPFSLRRSCLAPSPVHPSPLVPLSTLLFALCSLQCMVPASSLSGAQEEELRSWLDTIEVQDKLEKEDGVSSVFQVQQQPQATQKYECSSCFHNGRLLLAHTVFCILPPCHEVRNCGAPLDVLTPFSFFFRFFSFLWFVLWPGSGGNPRPAGRLVAVRTVRNRPLWTYPSNHRTHLGVRLFPFPFSSPLLVPPTNIPCSS